MLNCIWHIDLGERVVETDEYVKLLKTKGYYKTPWEAQAAKEKSRQKKLGEPNEKNDEKTGHNLHSKTIETSANGHESSDR